MRYAIRYAEHAERDLPIIQRYLPSNYSASIIATAEGRPAILIAGEDSAGWGLDSYVLPRLASGLYAARECDAEGKVL